MVLRLFVVHDYCTLCRHNSRSFFYCFGDFRMPTSIDMCEIRSNRGSNISPDRDGHRISSYDHSDAERMLRLVNYVWLLLVPLVIDVVDDVEFTRWIAG